MKRLLVLALLSFGIARANTLVVSDFSNFAPTLIVQPQPVSAADGPWSELTASSGAATYTVADFGSGAPSGLTGNGFLNYLAAPEDWSAYSYLHFTGSVGAANATPSLYFYVEDINASVSSFTRIDLSVFGSGPGVASVALDFSGLDTTQIFGWGFVTNEATATAFDVTFDHLVLSSASTPPAVPDAASSAMLVAGALAGLVGARRVRRKA